MDIKGKVHEISSVITVSDKFKKRELIIEYIENPSYPEYIKLEASQERVALFDNLRVGDQVEVAFNLRGRPWTDKMGKTTYFNTLNAWRINILTPDTTQQMTPEYATPVDISATADSSDDLPF